MNHKKVDEIFGVNDANDISNIEKNSENNKLQTIENLSINNTDIDETNNTNKPNNSIYIDTKLKEIIEQSTQGAQEVLELARVSEHPRAFEVYSILLKTQIDAVKELAEIEKTKLKLQQDKEKQKDKIDTINQTQINIGDSAVTGTNINKVLEEIRKKENSRNLEDNK